MVDALTLLLGDSLQVWSNVYETKTLQFEHDVVAVSDDLCLVVEAKAAPPVEPFRDPDKAFVRLRDAFRSNTGIQKAADQSSRIIDKLNGGTAVALYGADGTEVAKLSPRDGRINVGICVTRDNFGPVATNLSLLLEKTDGSQYPWAVNILDLANIAEAWKYFKWGPKEFKAFLSQRIQLHGKVFSDDELDYLGFFIRHGSFEAALKVKADLLQLNPEYSSIFDELYRHLHGSGPAVKIRKVQPVLLDMRRSFNENKPIFVDVDGERKTPKGRVLSTSACPCGSGRLYKNCCAMR